MTIMTTTPNTTRQAALKELELQLLRKPAVLTAKERERRLALIQRQIGNGQYLN